LYLVVVLALLVGGCQALTGDDVPATLQAEAGTYVAEATVIAETAQANRLHVMATADAAATKVADIRAINQVLLATVRAGDPADARGVVVNPISTPSGLDATQRWFVKTGISQSVSTVDGCVQSPQINFSTDTSHIYATLRAFNIQMGTQMSVAWYFEGNEVWRDSWAVPQNSADLCIWFDIEPSYVDFIPGQWSVRLFADGFQLEDPLSFTMTAPVDMAEN
jgi:hypothetical protein